MTATFQALLRRIDGRESDGLSPVLTLVELAQAAGAAEGAEPPALHPALCRPAFIPGSIKTRRCHQQLHNGGQGEAGQQIPLLSISVHTQ